MTSKNDSIHGISSQIFKKLLSDLLNESNLAAKNVLASRLTESVLCENGFSSFLDYLISVSQDSIEVLSIFCKIVLTRPAKYTSDLAYLMDCKENFALLILSIYRSGDEQKLRIFMTKLFFFMRRSQIENNFDFFLDSTKTGYEIFRILGSWKFYPDELQLVYLKVFKEITRKYLSGKESSNNAESAIIVLSELLSLDSLRTYFSEITDNDMIKVHSLWKSSEIPPYVLEASDSVKKEISSEDLQLEPNHSSYKLVEKLDQLSDRLSDSYIYECLVSSSEVDIVYGLHIFRKNINSTVNYFDDNSRIPLLLEVINGLFHNDSYVYSNAIKTCVMTCEYFPSVFFDIIFKEPRFKLDSSNTHILVRYIEIFLAVMKKKQNAFTKSVTSLLIRFCIDFLKLNISYEVKCSIFNFLSNAIEYNCDSLFHNQVEIFSSLDLSQREYMVCDSEARVIFRLIDTILVAIEKSGRFIIKDEILIGFSQFLRKHQSSTDSEILIMVYNNTIALEKLKCMS